MKSFGTAAFLTATNKANGLTSILPYTFIILVLVCAVMHFVLHYTIFGRGIYAIGGNPQSAHTAGFNVKRTKFIMYIIIGMIASASGICRVCMMQQMHPTNMLGMEMNIIAGVVLGGVMAAIWKKLAERPQGDMNMFKKVALGFLFVGLAFGVMVVCELVRGVGVDASVKASVFWPFLFVTVITIGEMCFSPLRNAFVSKYAPKKYLSLLMGVIAISTFGANKLSPFVQAFIEKFDVFPVFVGITVIMLVFTALIFLANKKLNSLVEGKEEA